MSEEEYPAQSFTFVQPREHSNVPQGNPIQQPQATLPSFSATFGPEELTGNSGPAFGVSEGQQPADLQPADTISDTLSDLRTLAEQGQLERDMRLSPSKRLLARAKSEMNQDQTQHQESQASDDQSSATSLVSGPREFSSTLEAAMPPAQKKRRQREPKVVTPTAASERSVRERRVPERLG